MPVVEEQKEGVFRVSHAAHHHLDEETAWHLLLQQIASHGKGHRLFMSYAWESGAANEQLQKTLAQIKTDLSEAGHAIFLDIQDMDKGITHAMEEGIKEAHTVLPILTHRFGGRVAEVVDEHGKSVPPNNLQFEFAHTISKIINSKNNHAVIPLGFAPREVLSADVLSFFRAPLIDFTLQPHRSAHLSFRHSLLRLLTLLQPLSPEDQPTLRAWQAACLHTLSSPNPHFVGRHTTLQRLTQHLEQHPNVPFTLRGPAGIGKTEVVQQLQQSSHYRFVHHLHAKDLETAAATMAAQLDVPEASLGDTLAQLEPGIFLFDFSDEVLPLPALPWGPHARILTQRTSVDAEAALPEDDASSLTLSPLSQNAALQYLAQRLPHIDPAEHQMLAEQLHYSPGLLTQACYLITSTLGLDIPTYCTVYGDQRVEMREEKSAPQRQMAQAEAFKLAYQEDQVVRAWNQLLDDIHAISEEKRPSVHILCTETDRIERAAFLNRLTQDLTRAGITVTDQPAPVLIPLLTPQLLKEAHDEQSQVAESLRRAGLYNENVEGSGAATTFSPIALGSIREVVKNKLAPLQDHLVRRYTKEAEYQSLLIGLSNPIGLLLSIHGLKQTDPTLLQALDRWRLSTLTQLPPYPAQFFGRSEALATLEKTFTQVKRQTIASMGGIGKSQLAMMYAHRATGYHFAYWVSADATRLESSFKEFASAIGIDVAGLKPEEIIQKVHHRLAKMPPGLLIFDNVVDEEAILPYLPEDTHHHVLITSRSQQWLHPCLRLTAFSLSEAIAYLKTRLPTATEEHCARLAKTLEALPLLLDQATAYILQQSITIEEYLSQYDLTKDSISATLNLSLEALESHNFQAIEFLYYCAYLQPDAIPFALTLFSTLFRVSLHQIHHRFMGSVSRYSLVGSLKPAHLNIHRLIQQALRDRDPDKEKRLLAITETLLKLFPQQINDAADVALQQQLIPHLEQLLEHWIAHAAGLADKTKTEKQCVELWTVLGRAYREQGNLSKAIVYFKVALESHLRTYGPDHPRVAIRRNDLGMALHNQGDLNGAIEHLKAALESNLRTYEPDHLSVAAGRSNLGLALKDQGDLNGAIEHLKAALESNLRTYEPDHPSVAGGRSNLGLALTAQGDLKGAIEHFKAALESDLRTYGPDHPSVTRDRNNLGMALKDQGEVEAAIEHVQAALESDLRTYGPDHPRVAKDRNNLGVALQDQGDLEGAIEHFTAALESDLRTYGPDHPSVATDRNNLGSALQEQGDLEGAIEHFTAALESDLRTYGPDHPSVATDRNNLGSALQDHGDLIGAIEHFKAALESNLRTYGADHPDVARDRNNLGAALQERGDVESAIEHFTAALESDLRTYGPEHPSVATGRNNLGSALQGQGDLEGAIEHFTAALESDLRTYGPDHPSVATDRNNLGSALQEQGTLEGAIEHFKAALGSDLRTYGPDHPSVATDRNNLGAALYTQGEVEGAIEQFKAALESDLRTYGPDHPNVARDRNNLGSALKAQGDLSGAIEYYKAALEIDLRTYGPDHSSVATDRNNLGLALQDQGDLKSAIEHFKAALEIDLRTYGPHHSSVATDRNNLGLALQDQGRLRGAIEQFTAVLESNVQTYGPDHPEVAASRATLGSALREQGNLKEAIEHLQAAFEIGLSTYGADHLRVANRRNNLGLALYEQGDFKEAIEHLQIALQSDLRRYGAAHHPNVNRDRNNLGLVLQAQGDVKGASELFQAALESDLGAYGPNHFSVARDRGNLGSALRAQGDLKGARAHLEAALQINLRTYGQDHFSVAKDRHNLGLVCQEQGDLTGAIEYFKAAFESNLRTYGPNHSKVIKNRNDLETALKLKTGQALSAVSTVQAEATSVLDHSQSTRAIAQVEEAIAVEANLVVVQATGDNRLGRRPSVCSLPNNTPGTLFNPRQAAAVVHQPEEKEALLETEKSNTVQNPHRARSRSSNSG
ncbi:MAG: hypothetical protein K0S27_1665 [Gammaproteobacteria bacterium]|jgi:tetratricopeptide (TPR) repeat protein/uncharacterized glyoxalase superfamily protein PhnB|nr:hypothetical protein [Gammaproteobacteria bacterium]